MTETPLTNATRPCLDLHIVTSFPTAERLCAGLVAQLQDGESVGMNGVTFTNLDGTLRTVYGDQTFYGTCARFLFALRRELNDWLRFYGDPANWLQVPPAGYQIPTYAMEYLGIVVRRDGIEARRPANVVIFPETMHLTPERTVQIDAQWAEAQALEDAINAYDWQVTITRPGQEPQTSVWTGEDLDFYDVPFRRALADGSTLFSFEIENGGHVYARRLDDTKRVNPTTTPEDPMTAEPIGTCDHCNEPVAEGEGARDRVTTEVLHHACARVHNLHFCHTCEEFFPYGVDHPFYECHEAGDNNFRR